MPSTAARVQANIGANKAFAFDLTAACSGFVFALSTAEKFYRFWSLSKGLVIGSETSLKSSRLVRPINSCFVWRWCWWSLARSERERAFLV